MLVRNSLLPSILYLEARGIMMILASYILRPVVALIATPCALCGGYFWSNGRIKTRARVTSSEHTSIARGVGAGSSSYISCAGFEPRGEAPLTVDIVSPTALLTCNREPGTGNQDNFACPIHAVYAGSFSRLMKSSTRPMGSETLTWCV